MQTYTKPEILHLNGHYQFRWNDSDSEIPTIADDDLNPFIQHDCQVWKLSNDNTKPDSICCMDCLNEKLAKRYTQRLNWIEQQKRQYIP